MQEWFSDNFGKVFFICVIILVGASIYLALTDTVLTEGMVTDKQYHKAHLVYSPIWIYSNGAKTIPRYRVEPDIWAVSVKNGDDTDVWYVTKEFYDSVSIGEWVRREK